MSGYLVRDEGEQRKRCGTCRYHEYDQDFDEWACDNESSEVYGAWTNFNDYCDEWEKRK